MGSWGSDLGWVVDENQKRKAAQCWVCVGWAVQEPPALWGTCHPWAGHWDTRGDTPVLGAPWGEQSGDKGWGFACPGPLVLQLQAVIPASKYNFGCCINMGSSTFTPLIILFATYSKFHLSFYNHLARNNFEIISLKNDQYLLSAAVIGSQNREIVFACVVQRNLC